MKHTRFFVLAAAALLTLGACKQKAAEAPVAEAPATDGIYQFSVLDRDGNTVSLSDYAGDVLLVVNTATHCGFTPQYTELEALYSRFNASDFEVLDFPCNQFGAQAPGTNEEIHAFCTGNYDITFPQMAKVDVNGDSASALFTWLKSQAPFQGFDTTDPAGAVLDKMFRAQDPAYDQNDDIKWNFSKFLVDREGRVVARFEPTEPMQKVSDAIEALLAAE